MVTSSVSQVDETEEHLRKRLVGRYQHLVRSKKALEPTYKNLLLRSAAAASRNSNRHTSSAAAATGSLEKTSLAKLAAREKLYKRINGEVRLSVEKYVTNPNSSSKKRGYDRKDLDDAQCRTCFTLRECKDHEQRGMVKMLVANGGFSGLAANGPFEKTQALNKQAALADCVKKLQHNEEFEHVHRARLKAQRSKAAADRARMIHQKRNAAAHRNDQTENMQRTHSLLDQRERDEARSRERQRLLARKLEEEDRTARHAREKEDKERKSRMSESPRQTLRRLYQPIFQALWDMEFDNLGNTNPFRIVIDKENCYSMGVPDYCEVIKTPMNLTYIQTKVNAQSYSTLQEFFGDVELMISNALEYNSDPANPYHVAAKELRKHYKKFAKRVVASLQQAQIRGVM
jgi:hypothetical protein